MAVKSYGENTARKIIQRMNELESADSVEMLVKCFIGRCHQLQGNRKGEYAMDLEHPYRLIFIKVKNEELLVKIVSIEDYH